MTKVEYQTQINAPVQKVYEYYTDPSNIQEAWPQDIVKESEDVSGSKNEEGSEMRVKGQYMGKEEEMRLQVVDKEENRKLVTRQIQGPFKKWDSIQEFHGNGTNATQIKHSIDFELPTTGKIANLLSGSQADNKIREALEQAAQTVKQKLESGSRWKREIGENILMSANRHEVGHFEIPADNVDGLRNFYSSLFGWEFEKGQTQGYYMIKNAGISGALAQKENPQQVSTQFVRVESIEDYINKAKQLGARVVKDRQEISEGYYAVLEDPQRNTIGIWQNKQ